MNLKSCIEQIYEKNCALRKKVPGRISAPRTRVRMYLLNVFDSQIYQTVSKSNSKYISHHIWWLDTLNTWIEQIFEKIALCVKKSRGASLHHVPGYACTYWTFLTPKFTKPPQNPILSTFHIISRLLLPKIRHTSHFIPDFHFWPGAQHFLESPIFRPTNMSHLPKTS